MAKKILMIDGDRPFAMAIASKLQSRGLEASVCGDGAQGLERVRAERPDVVVLCVELPRVSGYSICNKLKKDEQLRSIPLVITSSEATPQTFEQHSKLRTRADEYLLKPFEAPALLDKIAALVELPPEPAGGPRDDSLGAPEIEEEAGAIDLDDDSRLIDAAFDQLAIGGDRAAPIALKPSPRARPDHAGNSEQAQLRARIADLEARAASAEARATAAEARAAEADRRLELEAAARDKLRDTLTAALDLLQNRR